MQFTRPELQENPAAAIDALSRVSGSDAVNGERDALIGWLRSHNDAIAGNDQLSRASAAMTPALRNALPMLNDGQRADVAMELGVSPAALDQAWRAAAQTDTLPATGEAMAEPTGQLNSATTARVQAMIRRMMPEHDDIPAVDMSVAEGAVPRVDGGNNLGTPAGAIRPAASAVANPLQAEAEAAVPPADPLMSPSVSAPAREAANSVVASDGMSQATARVRDAAVDDPTVIPPEGQSNTMIQRLAELRADPQSLVARRAAAFVGQSAALARAVRTAASARAAFTRELDAQMQTLNASGDISADSDAAFRTLRSQMQAADAEVAARNERVANLITDVSQDLSGVSDEGAVADLTTVEPAQNGGVAPTLRARRAAQTDRLSIPLLDGDGRPLMLPPPSTRPLSEIQSAMDAVLRDRTSALSDVFGRIDSGVTQREHRNLLNRAGGVVRHSEVELARLQREMNAAVARADHMQALNALNNEELASAFTANKVRMKSLDESIRALEARRKVGEAISPQEQVLQNAWVHEYNELATANRHIEQVRKLPDASRGDATQDPFGGSAQATEQVSTSAADRYTNEGLRGLFAGPRPPDTLGALIRQITRWQSGAPWARKIEQVVMRWMPQTRVKVSAREEIAQITGHEDAFAAYDPYTDTIHLLDTSLDGKNVVHAAYHEAMHAVTLRAIRAVERKPERTTPQMQAAVARLQELHDYAKQHLGKTFDDGTGSHQWYDDLAEFASEAQANPLLRAGLEGIGRKGVVRRIFDAVLRLVGLGRLAPKSRAVLAEVMAATDELLPYNRQMFDKFQQIDRINRGLGDAAPMRKVQLPGAKRGETAEEYAVRIRNERTADPSVPRDPSNTAEKLDESTAKAAEKDAGRSIMFGRHVIDTGNEVAAVAMPTTEGYKLIYSDRYVRDDGRQVFDTVEEARDAALERGLEMERQGNYTGAIKSAKDTTFAFHDQRAHASPNVRAVADTMQNIVGRYDAALGDFIGSRVLALGSAFRQTNLTRLDWADSFDNALRARGIQSNLGRTLRNAIRAQQNAGAVTGDFLYDAHVDMIAAMKEAGVAYSDLSRYATAKHVPFRNDMTAGKNIAGSSTKFPADTTGFTYGGLKGTPAAEAYMASISPQRRETMDAILQRYYDAKADTLQLEYESGRLSYDEYVRLGGVVVGANGELVRPVKENFYVPLKSEPQVSARIGKISTGRKTEAHDPLGMAFADLRQRRAQAQFNFAMRELGDTMQMHPDPDFGLVQAMTHSGKTFKDGALKWGVADFKGDDSLFMWKDGKAYRMTFFDPQVIKYIHTSDPAVRNAFFRTLTAGIHLLQHFRTTFVPAFLGTATAWDLALVNSNMQAAYGGMMNTAQATAVSQRTMAIAGQMLGVIARRAVKRSTDDIYLQAYGRDGGGVGAGGRAGYAEAISRMRVAGLANTDTEFARQNPLTQMLHNAQAKLAVTSDVLHAPEEAVRFGTFKAGLEHFAGKTFATLDELDAWAADHPDQYAQALEASRKIVSDFADHGTQQFGSAMWMFFNPALQGARLTVDMYKTPQGKRAAVIMAAIGAATALGATGADDEDADGGSRHLRQTGRGRQMPLTDTLGLPLDPAHRMAFMLGDNLVMVGSGKQSLAKAGSELARSLFDTFIPVMPYGEDVPAEGLAMQYLMPSVVQPLATLGFGIDSFGRHTDTEYNSTYDAAGRRIVAPSNFERGKGSVDNTYKDIAAQLFNASNGAVDLYPGRLQAFAREVLGGVYSGVATAVDPVQDGRRALTRAFEHEYDDFALKREFDAVFSQRMSAARQLGADGLRSDPAALQEAVVAKRAREMAHDVTVGGFDQRALYQMLNQARSAGNDAAIRAVTTQLEMLRNQQNRIYGAALQRMREIENGRAAGAN